MGFYDNVEKGIDKLNGQLDEIKDSTNGIKETAEKSFMLSPQGRRSMNADAYALGEITLDEFIKREKEATFSMSKEEFNALPLAEQSRLYEEHPDKIRQILGK